MSHHLALVEQQVEVDHISRHDSYYIMTGTENSSFIMATTTMSPLKPLYTLQQPISQTSQPDGLHQLSYRHTQMMENHTEAGAECFVLLQGGK